MTRWLIASLLALAACTLGFDLPYGIPDPMLRSSGFINCEGHEIGYWNVLQRETPDGRKAIFLVLTSVDMVDPAFVICVVPPERRIMVMEAGRKL